MLRAVKEKRMAYRTRNEEDQRESREAERQAKREVARAKRLAWKNWNEETSRSEKQKEMFRIAKQMKKDRRDITGAKFIKDKRGDIKVQEGEIL